MNVGVSTIGDMFGQVGGPASALPRPEAPERRAPSPLAPAEPQAPADTTSQAPSQRDSYDIRPEPTDQGRDNFDEVIRKKTKSADIQEAPKSSKPIEPDAKSDATDQPGEVQAWVAQQSVAVQNTQKAATGKAEPKGNGQLAQLVAEPKGGESQPAVAVGEPKASAQLNLLATAAENQSGLKTVTPVTSKAAAAVYSQPGKANNAAAIPASNTAATVAKAVTQGINAKELTPEVATETAGKTINADIKPAIAETPAGVNTSKAPASNAKVLAGEALVDGNAKTAHTVAKAAVASDLPATAHQTQAQVVTADGQASVPTGEIEADAAAAQTPSKSPSLNSRKPALNSPQASNGSDGKQVNAAAVQAATGQTESGDNSNSNGSLNSGSDQMLSQTQPVTPIEQPSTVFAVDTKTASPPEQTLASNSAPSVGDQILDSVRSSLAKQGGDKQITIHLIPPELGKVFVKLQEQGAPLSGTLEVSNARTRLEIEQALPQIIRNLADSGIEVKRIEVVLTHDEQSGQQAFKDPSLQDGAYRQQNSANSGYPGDENQDAGTHYGPTGRGRYQSATELQQMVVRDDAIDILV